MKQDIVIKFIRYLVALPLAFVISTGHTEEYALSNSDIEHFQNLDKQFIRFSSAFYKHLLAIQHFRKISNTNLLLEKANIYRENNKLVYATGLLEHNISGIKNNVNSKAVIDIENILLEANDFNTAQAILDVVKNEGDPSLVSNVLYGFAKYYFLRNDWEKVVSLVNKIENDLPAKEGQHALFIKGISLQKLRKHRKAIAVYKKISKHSQFYTTSRINMAVSDFRQDWWTDAHIIINNLLKTPDVSNNKVLSDRLHTIIGYSFLQLEYFRNSRDSFRNVSLDGPYTNQAIIGIALDAAYQKDYVGALNAARVLKNKHDHDLESDESYLLIPYFYEKLQQNATASAGYTGAIKYYEDRLNSINNATKADISFYLKVLRKGNIKNIRLNNETISLVKFLPDSFFRQVHLLNTYRSYVQRSNNAYIKEKFNKLEEAFAKNMQTSVDAFLKEKVRYLTDYMNQCRYGLARMYDNSNKN